MSQSHAVGVTFQGAAKQSVTIGKTIGDSVSLR